MKIQYTWTIGELSNSLESMDSEDVIYFQEYRITFSLETKQYIIESNVKGEGKPLYEIEEYAWHYSEVIDYISQ